LLPGVIEVISHFGHLAVEPVCHNFKDPGTLFVKFPLRRVHWIW